MKPQLPSPFALLAQSWQFYVAHFWMLVKLVVMPMLLTLVLVGIVAVIVFGTNLREVQNLNLSQIAIIVPAAIAAAIFATIISLLGRVATIKFIDTNGDRPGVWALFKEIWPLLGSFFLTQLLTSLVVLVGFILLIIPGLIFSVRYLFTPFIVISEGKIGWAALKQSGNYVKGKFWGVLIRGIFIGLLTILISAGSTQIDNTIIQSVIQLFTALVLGPLTTIYFYKLYQACRLGGNDAPVSRYPAPAFS